MLEDTPALESRALTRRGFLKTSALVAGALAAYGGTTLLSGCDQNSIVQMTSNDDTYANCICRVNCFGACRIKCTIREGKIVNFAPAPLLDPNYNRICLRGLTHFQRIYDPDRILYPLKRIEGTKRGTNEFEQITWDEAIELFSSKINEAAEKYGPQSLGIWGASGSLSTINGGGGTPSFMFRFCNFQGATNIQNSVDMAQSHGQSRVVGGNMSSGLGDLINSKYIVTWGYNATESTIHSWHLIADGIDAGAKLVVIDPTYTTLASKADKWFQVKPGTDVALALSLMNVIYSNNLHDVDFLTNYTCAPFLVKPDGTYLRMSDLGMPAQTIPAASPLSAPTVIDPIAVWDTATDAAVNSEDGLAKTPAIEGTFTVAGQKCKTAFSHLIDEFSKYDPEFASEIVGLTPMQIKELALICADGPVAHLSGYGNQAYSTGVTVGAALATLPAITGNYGYEGAQQGTHWKFFPGFNYMPTMFESLADAANMDMTKFHSAKTIPNMCLPDVLEKGTFGFLDSTTGTYKETDWSLKILWQYVGNPMSNTGGTNILKEKVFSKFDFVVTSDNTFTDTCLWSDLILPIPHYFEQAEVHASGEHGFIMYSEKALEPMGESKSDADILRALTPKVKEWKFDATANSGKGGYVWTGEYMAKFFTQTDDEYTQDILTSEYCANLNISVDSLKKNGCMYDGTNPGIPMKGADGRPTFLTETGKVMFYTEHPAPRVNWGQKFDIDFERLPRYKGSFEASSDDVDLRKKFKFVIMSERPRFRVHSSWWSAPWLRELEPEPIVKINPEDAKSLGINNHDYVKVSNDRGHAIAKAIYHAGIRQGTVVYPKGWQEHQHKDGHGWSDLVNPEPDLVGVNGNFMDVLANIELWKG
ncbi:MAG: molybdopterin-dependent oxidoreductase [Coriobacteriales bacterium]|jgi:molybdopterin-containing oxidoreductase family molybdopterin binding subunit|nr:molybdopterin-dependent oxidoreductase [Coriobacteriales bacterium]